VSDTTTVPAPRRSFARSLQLHQMALELLPGGVSSNARLWHEGCSLQRPCTIFVEKANGSHLTDVDGNVYIDYRLGFGPVILGHSHPAVHDAVHRRDEAGLVFALPHEQEARVARQIRAMVPCAEFVRFANSGTEATMTAIRIARAVTGRERFVKFEGAYHGAHDTVLFSTDPPSDRVGPPERPNAVPKGTGIPKQLADLVVIQRFNQPAALETTFGAIGSDLAGVIVEPVMGNAAVIPPDPDFLPTLRRLCDAHGALLIFDEVKTGFRLAAGGAQEVYGVKPDLATVAKSMGNGYPVAAILGRRRVMQEIGPGRVVHGGTYSGNQLSLTAVEATLHYLREHPVYDTIRKFGAGLMKAFDDTLTDRKIPHLVQGHPAMFQWLLTDRPVREYRDLDHVDGARFRRIQLELLHRGVMIDEDFGEPMFTCFAHDGQDLDQTVEAFDQAIRAAG
jgi:glutamate-1-semialdehyde 2,1-aminomutase